MSNNILKGFTFPVLHLSLHPLMKKGIAFILLLCHMNFSMFLPQMAEQDSFDANGMQKDDINSVVEYVDEVLLGNPDDTPEDEDDDNGQNFHLVKTSDYFFQQISFLSEQKYVPAAPQNFSTYTIAKLASVSFEIITPPPEA